MGDSSYKIGHHPKLSDRFYDIKFFLQLTTPLSPHKRYLDDTSHFDFDGSFGGGYRAMSF